MIKLFCLIVQLSLFSSIYAQDCFLYYSLLKQNPLDKLALAEVLENCTQESCIEHLILLKSYIAHNNPSAAKESILTLSDFDMEEDYLNSIVSDSLWNDLKSDSKFIKDLSLIREKKRLFFESDTVSKIVQEAYVLDQSIRRFEKLSNSKGAIMLIDSIVMKQIFELLVRGKLSTTAIGLKNEEKLFICLLHEMRYVSDKDFEKWDSLLINLVNLREFNPYYYANIVDERLRVKESSLYPKYNYLRNVEVSKEWEAKIQMNRKVINAY